MRRGRPKAATANSGRKTIKVAPLTDEDRRMLVRGIDLGCPIDHDYDPEHPENRGRGWMLDDQRPTLTMTHPRAGANELLTRILVGMPNLLGRVGRDHRPQNWIGRKCPSEFFS